MTSNSFSSERFVVVGAKFYPTNQKTEVRKGYSWIETDSVIWQEKVP
jgi:hypothetical protein